MRAAAVEPAAVPPAMTELRRAARAARPEGLIDLSRSEPLPLPLADSCAARVGEEFLRARQYSPPRGLAPVRAAVARYASRRAGRDVDAERVTITAGAMAGISISLRALLAPGDEVLVPVPYFHSYPGQVAMLGGVPRLVDTRPSQGLLTAAAIEPAVGPRTRALLLCNPSNPAGVLLDADRLREILAALPPSVAIIADEVYAEYLYDDRGHASSGRNTAASRATQTDDRGHAGSGRNAAASRAAETDGRGHASSGRNAAASRATQTDDRGHASSGRNTAASRATETEADGRGHSTAFVSVLELVDEEGAGREVVALETASKTAGMPGWRVGAAIATPELAARLGGAAATLSGAPSTPAQLAYAAWLDEPPQGDRMAPYRPRLRDALEALAAASPDAGVTVRRPDGTYYLWVTSEREIGTADSVLEAARRTGVLAWPGILFGDSRSVRISLSVPRRELRDGVTSLTDSWREVREGDVPISRSGR